MSFKPEGRYREPPRAHSTQQVLAVGTAEAQLPAAATAMMSDGKRKPTKPEAEESTGESGEQRAGRDVKTRRVDFPNPLSLDPPRWRLAGLSIGQQPWVPMDGCGLRCASSAWVA